MLGVATITYLNTWTERYNYHPAVFFIHRCLIDSYIDHRTEIMAPRDGKKTSFSNLFWQWFIIKKFLCIPTYSLFHFGKSYYVRIKKQMIDLYKDRLSVLNITKHQTRSITALFFFVIFSDISSRILLYQYGRPNFDVAKKVDLSFFTLIFLWHPYVSSF